MLKNTIILFLVLFYSIEGHVSGREELLPLERVVANSQVIVIAEKVGEPKAAKTKDGLYNYKIQTFNVKKVLYPQKLSLKTIAVSTFDSYLYEIIKFKAEGKGNKIGIFARYEAAEELGKQQILFLTKSEPAGGGDYEYVCPGAAETPSAEKQVKELIAKK